MGVIEQVRSMPGQTKLDRANLLSEETKIMEQIVNIAASTGDKTIVIVVIAVVAAAVGFIFLKKKPKNK